MFLRVSISFLEMTVWKFLSRCKTSLVFPSVRVFDLYLHQLRETDGALSLAFASSMEIPIASSVGCTTALHIALLKMIKFKEE